MSSRRKEKTAGVFQQHCACPLDMKIKGKKIPCGSSDAGCVYLHDDGSHSFFCQSCYGSIVDFDTSTMSIVEKGPRVIDWEVEQQKIDRITEELIPVSYKERKMKEDIYDFYGVRMELEDNGKDVKVVYYPTYRDGTLCGYRNRKKFEAWMDEVKKKPSLLGVPKCFRGGVGDTGKGIEMYGQHLFPAGGKRIIVTCGEEDAHAAYHMTSMKTKFEGGYPCVSVPSGENIAWVKPNLKYLSSFDDIIFIPDPDKKGKEFEQAFCKILPVGKVRIARMPKDTKDPSGLWKAARSDHQRKEAANTFWNAIWEAEKYSPAGIMSLSEGWGSYMDRGSETLISFPESFGELNKKTHGGYALGEIVNIIAPSSVGKSSFVKEMIYAGLQSTNYNIAVISLEETIDEFIEGFLSVHMSTQLNEIPYDERDRKTEWEAFQELLKIKPLEDKTEDDEVVERIHFLDHQGACDGDELLEKIDFLINGLDCKIIILDPVTLAVSGDTDQDEMASDIVKRVKGKKLAWVNVHHVRKNSTGATANSEGGDLSEEDIKGTGAWFQTGMINLIFTRNKVHDNDIVRNTTTIKMSKCRRHGKSTGMCGWIHYNGETGRLEKGTDPVKIMEAENAMEEANSEWEFED